MEPWLGELALAAPYAVVVAVILAGGLGVPVPEDVPLVLAGYLAGQGHAEPALLLPLAFLCTLCADLTTFGLGWRFGGDLARLPVLRRLLSPRRVERAHLLMDGHGGKIVFASRFVPGLRSPMIFAAGSARMPLARFLASDAAAAAIGVSAILGLSYLLSDQIEWVRQRVAEGQLAAVAAVALCTSGYVAVSVLASRKLVSGTERTRYTLR